MNKIVYMTIGLIFAGGGKTFADNSLTGLHLGFGLNVVADEYKSDVDVLGKLEYASGGEKWTFTGQKYDGNIIPNGIILPCNTGKSFESGKGEYKAEINGIMYYLFVYPSENRASFTISRGDEDIRNDIELNDFSNGIYTGDNFTAEYDSVNNAYNVSGRLDVYSAHLGISFVKDIMSKSEGSSSMLFYGDKYAEEITYSNASAAYLNTSKHLKAKTNRIGGELKMSYFHNLTDHLVLGVDVCGTLNQKAKKNVLIEKLNYVAVAATHADTADKKYRIYYEYEDGFTIEAIYKNGEFTSIKNIDTYYDEYCVERFFKNVTENGITYIPERQYTIESLSNNSSSVDITKLTELNPGYTEVSLPSDTSQYLQISNEKGGDVTFEKNKFNSRAAVVLGAQYKGWFAGIRGGVSYNQGKIHAKDATGTSTEDVSFATPFVGLHLMKSINMKGLENGHIYVTADVNVQNKQNLKMKGIKNFRQNSVNVSLGMTWQIN